MLHLFPLQAAEAAEQSSNIVKEVANSNFDFSKISDQLISYAIEGGKSLLIAIIIYFVGRFIIKMINKVVSSILVRRDVDLTIQSFVKSFVNVLLTTLLVIAVVNALGVDTTSFAALLASLGLAAGMALSGNLQNLAGGIMLLLFRPFRVGDFISAQGETGTVKAIQMLHTIILTTDNREVILPNGALSSGNMTNFSAEKYRRVDLTVCVEYGTDTAKVKSVLDKLILSEGRIIKDVKGYEHFVALSALSPSSVDFTVRMWVESANYWGVFFDMNEKIYETFKAEGISFPFPQLKVHQA
ncbi:MAG: mechanosensitive ion channel [Bacteroidaceae bacterium]|nr:mechanosensitive ion channel [Bacteroidaceae bacterium]